MKPATLAAICIASAAATLSGWQGVPIASQPTAQGTGLILGRVVDADTGAAVSGVVVTLGGDLSVTGTPVPPPAQRSLFTDGQGRFVFRSLPKGTYTLNVTIGGTGFSPTGFVISGLGPQIGAYLNGGYGQRRPHGPMETIDLADGQRIGDAVIRLWKGAAIEGLVTDEANEPAVGVAVAAARRTSDGRLLTGPATRTDDRGAYRLGTLAPAEYVVVVPQTQVLMPASTIDAYLANPTPQAAADFGRLGAPSPAITGMRLGETVSSTGAPPYATNTLWPAAGDRGLFVYQTTFYQAEKSSAQAVGVRLKAGEVRSGVNLRLQPSPAVAVSGTLMDGASPVQNSGVHLMPADLGDGGGILEVAITATDSAGKFSFPAVPPGQYRLLANRLATAPPANAPSAGIAGTWAEQAVTVGDRPVANLTLSMRPAIEVAGRVEFQGSASRPPANRLQALRVVAEPVQPTFRDGTGRRVQAPIDASGAFVLRGIVPGAYTIGVTQAFIQSALLGWTLQSVTLGARDVTDRALALNADLGEVVVTFTDRPASLTGTVRGAAAAGASVLLFPSDRAAWKEARAGTRIFRLARPSKTGAFIFGSLVAGAYLAIAVPDEMAGDWPDAAFLSKLAPLATPVQVGASTAATVTLGVASVTP